MINRYEVHDDKTVIFVKSRTLGIVEVLIDTEDLKLVDESFSYLIICRNYKRNLSYVSGKKKNDEGTMLLHRLVTNAPRHMMVDHINHNTLDNRKKSLRLVTNAENQQNRKGAPSNSKSGIRGVHWHKKANKWHSQFKLNGKKITVGYYESLHDAELAVSEARKRHMPFANEK